MPRRLTPSEEKLIRENNLDNELKAIDGRLGNMEKSLQIIQQRDAILVQMQFRIEDFEKRIKEIESTKSTLIRIVVGSVVTALVATVVGVKLS